MTIIKDLKDGILFTAHFDRKMATDKDCIKETRQNKRDHFKKIQQTKFKLNFHPQIHEQSSTLRPLVIYDRQALYILEYNSQYFISTMSKHKQLFAKNPWHSVPYGAKSPQIVNAIIEIPAESKVKYELDKDSGLLKLDRILFSAVHYPHNYGFIPQTYCDDHDPLDILVICSAKVEPLCLVEAKVIGVMRMLDQGEGDDKIIAVAASDMSVSHYTDIKELPEHLLQQVHRFFEDYKKMEKKKVEVLEFLGHEQAWKIVEDSIKLYEKDFGTEKMFE